MRQKYNTHAHLKKPWVNLVGPQRATGRPVCWRKHLKNSTPEQHHGEQLCDENQPGTARKHPNGGANSRHTTPTRIQVGGRIRVGRSSEEEGGGSGWLITLRFGVTDPAVSCVTPTVGLQRSCWRPPTVFPSGHEMKMSLQRLCCPEALPNSRALYS